MSTHELCSICNLLQIIPRAKALWDVEPAEFYYFPKVKTTKAEVSEICVKLFEKGAADLTKYGPYENVDDKLCVES